ncbi:MAG: hypothetical protein IJV35_07155 [Neisseriaceae bacterium]|nr:hypothetical protein [Neisseriaceae bacterium]
MLIKILQFNEKGDYNIIYTANIIKTHCLGEYLINKWFYYRSGSLKIKPVSLRDLPVKASRGNPVKTAGFNKRR